MSEPEHTLSPHVVALNDEFLPIIRRFAVGRYAISVGGSQGKGTWDSRSDVDYRLFYEGEIPGPVANPELWRTLREALDRWAGVGVIVDGVWMRKIAQIDAALDRWLSGEGAPDDMVWTIWGYYPLPDIYHQGVIEDPYGVIAGWKQRLSVYPPALKRAVLSRHLASLRYWWSDYHYRHKVERGDVVFTTGLTAKLVHSMIQVLFALNETYYVGDGENLDFVARFRHVPPGFGERVREVLYPAATGDRLAVQYEALLALIAQVLALVDDPERG